jgi:hypothetical protein
MPEQKGETMTTLQEVEDRLKTLENKPEAKKDYIDSLKNVYPYTFKN